MTKQQCLAAVEDGDRPVGQAELRPHLPGGGLVDDGEDREDIVRRRGSNVARLCARRNGRDW